jgi:Xaa-Pro aminopeptidase
MTAMINPDMQDKIRRQLTEKQQDALLVYSAGTMLMLNPSYLLYLTGVRPAGQSAAIVTRDGQARFLVQPAWDRARVAARTWIHDVRGSSNLCRDLISVVRELCPSGRLAGVGLSDMPEDLYAALEAESAPVSGHEMVECIAREKSPAELAGIRNLARIADAGFNAMLEHARPGVREFELAARIEEAMLQEGADDNFILVNAGPHNHEMHEPTDRTLESGDLVLGEISPGQEGQYVQLCRTIVLGEPTPELLRAYDMLLAALHAALAQVRAGAPAGLMAKAMNGVISKAGYAKFCYPPYMRARGHGFGVGSIAPGGAIDDGTTKPFEAGQVVVVHPNQYLEETGYLACGEGVLVTADGFERLAHTETRLYRGVA